MVGERGKELLILRDPCGKGFVAVVVPCSFEKVLFLSNTGNTLNFCQLQDIHACG